MSSEPLETREMQCRNSNCPPERRENTRFSFHCYSDPSSAKPMDSTTRPKSTACWTRPTEGTLSLPAGITVEGATPPQGRGKGWPKACPPLTSPAPRQRRKKGGRSLHQCPFSYGALSRRAKGETREAQPRFALSQEAGEIRVIPRPLRRFGKVPNHNGEGSAL